MNFITRLSSVVQHLVQRTPVTGAMRTFSALSHGSLSSTTNVFPRSQCTLLPLQNQCVQLNQTRGYKVKQFPKRRCAGCYFERRFGRLYVECTLKPRHKQMQLVKGMNFYRDDYSKGKWKKASIWGFIDKKIFYQLDNSMAKYDWLKGRIGKDL